jgi:topoisomerase-4 subunit B
MPPLFRIDVGKKVHYALDRAEKDAVLKRVEASGTREKVTVQRFKGLGEMNPLQLRETTLSPDTRRLVQLTVAGNGRADEVMDLLLSRRRAGDRRSWLETRGVIGPDAEPAAAAFNETPTTEEAHDG